MKITPFTFNKTTVGRAENRIEGDGADVRSGVLLKTREF
jgi:hypothetical protein